MTIDALEENVPSLLEQMGKQYERELDAEYERYIASLRPRHIFVYSPRRTMSNDVERKEQIDQHLLSWTERWWKERGYKVVVLDQEETTFKVELF